MTWLEREWDAFAMLLEEGWHGDFDDQARAAWRVLLDGLQPEQAITGLRRLLHEGRPHRPSASEVIAAANHDPTVPTFPEALRLIQHALKARPPAGRWPDESARRRAYDIAAQARLVEAHPFVRSFVATQTISRLRALGLDDPDHGPARRRMLEQEYTAHTETQADREVAALASGRGRGELQRLDPLAHLQRPDMPAITEGAAR